MTGYVSMCWLRYDQPRKPDLEIGGAVRIFSGPSEECGCPEEEWEVQGLPLLIHFEPDGTAEAVFTPDEDVELQWAFEDAVTMEELREQALDRVTTWLSGSA